MNKYRKITTILFSTIPISIYAIAYFCFILSLVKHLNLLLIISGIIILFSSFFNLFVPLIKRGKIHYLEWIEIAANLFTFIILLSIYYSTIQDEKLLNILTVISASSLGGIFTVYGVALTIKYSRMEKEEDELKRNHPHIFIINTVTWRNLEETKKNIYYVETKDEWSEIKRSSRKNRHYHIHHILIGNSDSSFSIISGILINNKLIKFSYEQVLLKNSLNRLILDFDFNLKEEINSIDLLVEDMMNHIYISALQFEINKEKGNKEELINIVSGFDTIYSNQLNKI